MQDQINGILQEMIVLKDTVIKLSSVSSVKGIDEVEGGYLIEFTDGNSIVLKHRITPVISIGDNGNWYIDGVDTGKKSYGANGITPSVSILDGYWVINGIKTEVKAVGIDGKDAPYIQSISIVDGELVFYFSDNTTLSCVIKDINYNDLQQNIWSINRQGYPGYPEQSNISFIKAGDAGFCLMECAVRFTSDNIPVLLHDESINRVARNKDGCKILETINIADITFEEVLTKYDFGWYVGYKGLNIPTFEDFVKLCKKNGYIPVVEMKVGGESEWLTLIKILQKYGMQNIAYYNLFHTKNIMWIAQHVYKPNMSFGVSDITEELLKYLMQYRVVIGKAPMFNINYEDYIEDPEKKIRMEAIKYGCRIGIWGQGKFTNNATVMKNLVRNNYINQIVSDKVVVSKF